MKTKAKTFFPYQPTCEDNLVSYNLALTNANHAWTYIDNVMIWPMPGFSSVLVGCGMLPRNYLLDRQYIITPQTTLLSALFQWKLWYAQSCLEENIVYMGIRLRKV